MHYHDTDDLKRIKDLGKLAPEEFKAWLALDRIVAREDGKIPRKYRELMALAVAHTTQCVYCTRVHTKAAKKRRVLARGSRRGGVHRRGAARRRGGRARHAGAEVLR